MQKLELKWIYVVLIVVSINQNYVTAQDQQDASPNDGEVVDEDYSQPGQPTGNCTCVPLYQCEKGEIVTDGSFLLDARKKLKEELPIDEQYVPPECGPFHVCCGSPETAPGETRVRYVHRCGTRNPNGIHARILTVQGTGEAEVGEWPFQAAILKRVGDNDMFKCGGTIIDEKHVLTVAHCATQFLDKKAELVVRLGIYDMQNDDADYPSEDFAVSNIIIHPDYRVSNLYNDIAILELDRDIEYKPHIDSICLPGVEDNFVGHKCIVTGWGKTAFRTGAHSAILKEIGLPIISNDECQSKLRQTTRLGKRFRLFEGFMCAGGNEGEDSCEGDGGGPLFCHKEDGSYALVGLVAWGIECGKADRPGVYVNIQKYLEWIIEQTGKPIENYWA